MQQDKHTPSEPEEPGEGEGHSLLNIGKTVLLVVVLVAAWYILEWLMGGK
jgi:hypothetical protein